MTTAAFPSHHDGAPSPRELHARALAAWGAGDRRAALEDLRRAARGSCDLEILNDLGVAAAGVIGAETGRTILDTVLAIDGEHQDARENRAMLAAPDAPGDWRRSATLGGPDPEMPERAFPGMPAGGVMREHALRYSFALDLVAGCHVLDLACGTGYGSEMLTWTAASVRGFDLWIPEPHEVPRWPGGTVLTYGHDLCAEPLPDADVAVMFEVIEHLADAPRALRTAWGAVGAIIASFPNPVFHGSHHNPYHVNDWTLEEFEHHLADAARARFGEVRLVHYRQDYRDGSGGVVLPGRDPDASYWIVVAQGAA